MKSFDQCVAAITGAGSGLGRSLALQLAKSGCHVALADQNFEAVQAVQSELADLPVSCTVYEVDVADRAAVEQFARNTVEDHGQVHMIFNNAGVALADKVESQSYEDFEWLMNINFWGVVYGTRAFLPFLQENGSGHIINISSLFGLGAVPTQSAYNASKFAVRGFTEALKMELAGTGVGVSCVHPGGIRTNIASAARIRESNLTATRDQFLQNFDKLAKTTAKQAANVILKGVLKNKRRILIGRDARIADIIIRLFPGSYERFLRLEKKGLTT